jgi:hypothetical protein
MSNDYNTKLNFKAKISIPELPTSLVAPEALALWHVAPMPRILKEPDGY